MNGNTSSKQQQNVPHFPEIGCRMLFKVDYSAARACISTRTPFESNRGIPTKKS
jgi:hypothetical protein